MSTHAEITGAERLCFNRGLRSAKREDLTREFIEFYKRDRRRGASIRVATIYAMHEWDL